MHFKNYPNQESQKSKKTVSSFIEKPKGDKARGKQVPAKQTTVEEVQKEPQQRFTFIPIFNQK
jgi:hypothetical protein